MAKAGVVEIDVEPNLRGVGSKIDRYARTLQPIGFRTELLSTLSKDLERESLGGQRSLDAINTRKAQGELRTLGGVGEKELGRVGGSARLSNEGLVALGAGSVAVGARMIGALRPAVDAASDLNEAISYSGQVFGKSSGEIEKWAEGAASSIGQSKRAAIEAASDFATFGKAAGLTGQELVGFSTDLTKLASDLASAKNTTPEEAVLALGAALRGETEPIRRYGVLLDDASVRQEALALGIVKTTKDALTPQQKVLAVNSLLFKQTTDAQGDFARTADGVANSQRKVNAELENTKAKAGEGLLGVLSAANAAASTFLNTLDKIPGATSALGIGVAALGGAAIIGGGISSILGAVRAVQDFRRGTAEATVEMGGLSTASTVAAASTGEVAVAMEAVEVTSAKAGVVSSATLGGITTQAAAATAALASTAAAMAAVGSAPLAAGALGAGPQVAQTVGNSLVPLGGAVSPSGIKIDADVMDLTAIEDDLLAIEAGATGAASAVGDVAGATAAAGAASGAASGGLSRIGGALKDIGSSVGGGISNLRGIIGSLPALSVGFGAATIAVAGFSSAWSQLKDQTAEGIKASTIRPEDLIGAFDPEIPAKYTVAVEEVAQALAQVNAVGDKDAWDTLNPFDSDWEDRANLARSTIEQFKATLERLPSGKARQFVEDIAAKMERLKDPTGKNAEYVKQLYAALDEKESVDRASGAINTLGGDLERLGVKLQDGQSKWEQYSTVLGGIFQPGLDAISAQRAVQDGQRAVDQAQQRLTEIITGNTDGMRSATEALQTAREELNKAVAKTGPGSRAAKDAAKEVRDAVRAYRDLLIEAGKTSPGDFFEDRRADLQDAYEKIIEAQGKLNDVQTGNTEEVISARERLAEAQKRYNDEAAKTGPNSKEAADAQRELNDRQADMLPLLIQREQAESAFQEQLLQHPEAIQASIDKVDEWVKKGEISVGVAEQWKQKLLEAAAAAQQVTDNLPGGDTGSGSSGKSGKAGGKPDIGDIAGKIAGGVFGAIPKVLDKRVLSERYAKTRGFPLGAQFNFTDGHEYTDSDGRVWFYQRKKHEWVSYFATGGLARGVGGGDTVPAMLSDGEFVLNKAATQNVGVQNLAALNSGAQPGWAEVVDVVQALRGDLISTVRLVARTVSPGAGEELAGLLKLIEMNTRRGGSAATSDALAYRRRSEAEFVR